MKEKKIFQPLSSNEICQIYESLHEHNFVSFPITLSARERLDGLVASTTGSYFGKENYETAEEKAVAYFYFIIKDHPFTDGNKRTASLTFSTICEYNFLRPDFTRYTLDQLAIYIEKIREDDHRAVIKTLASYVFRA